jgi:glycosyltransferase involved in cell wall biosynthesis
MVQRAFRVICNTEPVRQEFLGRYGNCPDRFVTIPNGFDAQIVDRVRQSAGPPAGSTLRLVHTGGFYGPRDPRPFFAALAMLAQRRPQARQSVRFQQYGPTDYAGEPLARLAAQAGAAELVEVLGSVGHVQALTAVAQAHVAVAAGQVGPGSDLQVPRKFYEYLGLGRPILATGGTCRALAGLLGGRREGIWLVEQAQPEPLCAALEEIYGLWLEGTLKGPAGSAEQFSDQRMAQRLRQVLQAACQAAPNRQDEQV